MASLWKLGGLDSIRLAKRVWNEIQKDDVFGRAAQLSYYFLLSLFPLLIFLTSVIGLVIGTESNIRQNLFNYLSHVMPPAAYELIESTMQEVTAASNSSKISLGILAALWAASNGMGAITEALNVAYDVKESRPWWKQRLTAIGLTTALSVLIITALVIVLSGGKIADTLSANYATYGSLGAVIILMLWLYFTGAAVLIGGEVNAEIENAAAQLGVADAKEKSEKKPGEGTAARAANQNA